MAGRSIHRAVAMLAAATMTAGLAASALAAPTNAAKPTVECDGMVATKVGTQKADVIRGTRKRDIIAGLGGHDIILGLGGHDIICGGPGNDRLVGNAGIDRLVGGGGRDRLFGGGGPDRLFGGAHGDLLDGGAGVDLCRQGPGTGRRARCELPTTWEAVPVPKVLAIAYSNMDLNPGFDPAHDVLIAKMVDTDGNGADAGDRVVMDRYPTVIVPGPRGFGKWGVTSHTITSAVVTVDSLTAYTAIGEHQWLATSMTEQYFETVPATANSLVQDNHHSDKWTDTICMMPESPSQPASNGCPVNAHDPGDDPFIDVDLFH